MPVMCRFLSVFVMDIGRAPHLQVGKNSRKQGIPPDENSPVIAVEGRILLGCP